MNVLAKVYNKLLSVIILLFVLYSNIFIISEIYDINKVIDKHEYVYQKYENIITMDEYCELFECTAIRINNKISY